MNGTKLTGKIGHIKKESKLLLYCTKAKPILRDYRGKAIYNRFVISPSDRPFTSDDTQPILNGKIVIECDYEVEKVFEENGANNFFYTKLLNNSKLEEKSCLNLTQLKEYLFKNILIDKNAKGLEMFYKGYAIHIKNLHIFSEPKELGDYYTKVNDTDRAKDFFGLDVKVEPIRLDEWFSKYETFKPLKKAPQNIQKIIIYNEETNEYNYTILIPVSPEEMCRIANKEQDVLVRKRVLKEMLK